MSEGLRIHHWLTDTPLAREHRLSLRRREPRRLVEIPWDRFRRDRYSAPALDAAYRMHLRLAVGEQLAVETFSRVTAALVRIGAPLDAIGAAARVVNDEIRHADQALRAAALLGGRRLEEVTVTVGEEELAARDRAYAGGLRTMEEMDLWMAEVPAWGETLACGLLLACSRGVTDPALRPMYRALVADEVRHARLGWYWLAWRRAAWSDAERRRIAERVRQLVAGAAAQFGQGVDLPSARDRRDARALAVLDTPAQRAALAETIAEEVVPGFEALGLPVGRAAIAR